MKVFIYTSLFLLWFGVSFGQVSKQGQMTDLLKKGKEQVHSADYQQANLTFRRILTLNQPIPSDFCFYFAKTLFHIGQYKNSKSFINKYYELSGQGGEYFSEIKHLEQKVDFELTRIIECDLCNDDGYRLTVCHTCEGEGSVTKSCPTCKGKGNLICNVCGGEGVIIRKNVFNANEYQTCTHCQGTGIMACPTCEGKKQVETTCPTCKGLGGVSTGAVCNHIPEPAAVEKTE